MFYELKVSGEWHVIRNDNQVLGHCHVGLSKVAGCRRKSLPTWLVSAGYSAWHFFSDGVFQIKYQWTGCLL